MRYTNILQTALYAYAVGVVILFAAVGETALVSVNTIALTLLMVVAFSIALIVPCQRSTELRIAFVTFAALFLLPSIPGYLLYPGQFPFGGQDWAQVAVDDVNRALIFVAVGTLVATAGFSFGSHIGTFIPRSRRSRPPAMPIGRLVAIGLVFVGMELYLGIRFRGFSTDVRDTGVALSYLTRLFSSDSFTIVALAIVAYRWRQLSRFQRAALLAMVILIVVHKTLIGARSSVLVVIMICFVILLDRFGDFRLSPRALTILVSAALAAVLVFPVATVVREYWLTSSRMGYFASPREFWEIKSSGEPRNQIVSSLAYELVYRLNGLDPIATIATGRQRNVDTYVSLAGDAKSFVNIVVPGTPFPGAIERSKTFPIVYRGFREDYYEKNYVTSMWMLWGDCLAMFGFVGGLAAMFVLCAIFAAGFVLVVRWRGPGSAFLRVAYLFFTYALVVDFGLDTLVATAIYYLIPVFVLLLLCGVFAPYLRWFLEQPVVPRRKIAITLNRA